MVEINLDKENINKKTIQERKEFSDWLDKSGRSITGIESVIEEKNGNMDDILKGLAMMEIEIDTAADYARKREVDTAGYILAQAKHTKDFIYQKLMEVYGIIDSKGRILSLNLDGNLILWRDYIMQKYDGGLRRCEFLLSNADFI